MNIYFLQFIHKTIFRFKYKLIHKKLYQHPLNINKIETKEKSQNNRFSIL